MPSPLLRRYTSLPILLASLQSRGVTLVSPLRWSDRNDTAFLRAYQRQAQLRSLLALCFTETSETSHHWGIFAPGSSGVCVVYRRAALLKAAGADPRITGRSVIYQTLRRAGAEGVKVVDLPFLKRWPYRSEKEFRLIFASPTAATARVELPVPLSAIDRIYLSPALDEGLVGAVKRTIKGIKGCDTLKVYRSTLTGNAAWKELGARAR